MQWLSHTPFAASCTVERQLWFEGVQLPLQDHIKILGVTVDRELRCKSVAHQISLCVSALLTMAGSLDLTWYSNPL
ncbi:hypothetical protein E2C01_100422 [Portunus trituberculatus]|uniref:Uncharacterized protein n=1 Tax=Portunus trituberculatus TaxID=210409 RepID=A0A5B7KDI1_PORTR|nr:hypothetical protein [Portunus trituberculatus]